MTAKKVVKRASRRQRGPSFNAAGSEAGERAPDRVAQERVTFQQADVVSNALTEIGRLVASRQIPLSIPVIAPGGRASLSDVIRYGGYKVLCEALMVSPELEGNDVIMSAVRYFESR